MKDTILLICEDKKLLEIINIDNFKDNYNILNISLKDNICNIITNRKPALIICEQDNNNKAFDILDITLNLSPESQIIIVLNKNDANIAIDAFRKGAVDCFLKPVDKNQLKTKIDKMLKKRVETEKSKHVRKYLNIDSSELDIIGNSKSIIKILSIINTVALTDCTVLISGESGTGKELFSKLIHQKSKLHKLPFIAINCSCFSESLLESELFGHKKGSFTNAHSDKAGFFEAVGEGTIFLDEIGEIPLNLQSKLLRVLEEKEFYKIGSTTPSKFMGRIVAATNKDLHKLVEEKKFREDLYYRIGGFEIKIPPLRDRRADIPLLVNYFIDKYNTELGRDCMCVDNYCMENIMTYNWPGNVRELKNSIERAIILCQDGCQKHITKKLLPMNIFNDNRLELKKDLKSAVEYYEKNYISQVLQDNSWDISHCSKILDVNQATLYRKIDKFNIVKDNAVKEDKSCKSNCICS